MDFLRQRGPQQSPPSTKRVSHRTGSTGKRKPQRTWLEVFDSGFAKNRDEISQRGEGWFRGAIVIQEAIVTFSRTVREAELRVGTRVCKMWVVDFINEFVGERSQYSSIKSAQERDRQIYG